jgi:hypothetical protein
MACRYTQGRTNSPVAVAAPCRAVVAVVRLVHVPEEDEVELFMIRGAPRDAFMISSAAS